MRQAILALGRYSRWPRSELRAMSPQEFAAYVAAADDMEKEHNSGT